MRLVDINMKVLFLCAENSARSIMAQALLNYHGDGQYQVYSAGTHPSTVDERTVAAISHFGLPTDNLTSKSYTKYTDIQFDYVITLCDSLNSECEQSISGQNCLHWHFPEPKSRKDANPFEKTMQEINERITLFLTEIGQCQSSAITPTLFYKSLADNIRLKTLLLIAVEYEICVCELMVALEQESQPKVSRHLAQLKKAGILSDRKQQKWVFYSLNPTLASWMKQVITSTVVNEPHFIENELNRLNQMGDRPARKAQCCE